MENTNNVSSNKKAQEFKAPHERSYVQILPAVVFIPSIILLMVFILPSSLLVNIENENMDTFQWLSFAGIYIFAIGGLYTLINATLGFWKSSYFVYLEDDKVVGYNLWKQKRTMFYNDIVSIKKNKRSNSILLQSFNGDILRITADIDAYGKCIEIIRARAINVREVDYGGLDRNKKIWRT